MVLMMQQSKANDDDGVNLQTVLSTSFPREHVQHVLPSQANSEGVENLLAAVEA